MLALALDKPPPGPAPRPPRPAPPPPPPPPATATWAFSFLSSAPGWQRELFVAIGIGASALIVYLLRRHAADPLFCFALSLILGGAIGNVIDRVLLGAVVDVLDVHVAGHHWPAFNLADSAISCGAVLLIWDSMRRSRVERAPTKP